MALTTRIALTRPPLELHAAPAAAGDGGLELGLAAVAEARAHPEEVLARRVALDGSAQPEERVVLHGALPQVLARFFVVKPAKMEFTDLHKFKILKN